MRYVVYKNKNEEYKILDEWCLSLLFFGESILNVNKLIDFKYQQELGTFSVYKYKAMDKTVLNMLSCSPLVTFLIPDYSWRVREMEKISQCSRNSVDWELLSTKYNKTITTNTYDYECFNKDDIVTQDQLTSSKMDVST